MSESHSDQRKTECVATRCKEEATVTVWLGPPTPLQRMAGQPAPEQKVCERHAEVYINDYRWRRKTPADIANERPIPHE